MLGADLSQGFDTFQQLDDTADDHLDSLLKTIMALEERTGAKQEVDVITWRGMMTKVRALAWMPTISRTTGRLQQPDNGYSFRQYEWVRERSNQAL